MRLEVTFGRGGNGFAAAEDPCLKAERGHAAREPSPVFAGRVFERYIAEREVYAEHGEHAVGVERRAYHAAVCRNFLYYRAEVERKYPAYKRARIQTAEAGIGLRLRSACARNERLNGIGKFGYVAVYLYVERRSEHVFEVKIRPAVFARFVTIYIIYVCIEQRVALAVYKAHRRLHREAAYIQSALYLQPEPVEAVAEVCRTQFAKQIGEFFTLERELRTYLLGAEQFEETVRRGIDVEGRLRLLVRDDVGRRGCKAERYRNLLPVIGKPAYCRVGKREPVAFTAEIYLGVQREAGKIVERERYFCSLLSLFHRKARKQLFKYVFRAVPGHRNDPCGLTVQRIRPCGKFIDDIAECADIGSERKVAAVICADFAFLELYVQILAVDVFVGGQRQARLDGAEDVVCEVVEIDAQEKPAGIPPAAEIERDIELLAVAVEHALERAHEYGYHVRLFLAAVAAVHRLERADHRLIAAFIEGIVLPVEGLLAV